MYRPSSTIWQRVSDLRSKRPLVLVGGISFVLGMVLEIVKIKWEVNGVNFYKVATRKIKEREIERFRCELDKAYEEMKLNLKSTDR